MKTLLLTIAFASIATAQSEYTGYWYRNSSKSDDPEPKLQAAIKGFVQKTTRGKSTVNDVEPEYVKRLNGIFQQFLQYADELYIELSTRELVVDDDGDVVRIYYLDGKKHERQIRDGTRLETIGTRVGNRVDIAMKTQNGAKIFETYELLPGGDELVLTVRLEDKQLKQPLVIRSVYDRND